MKKLILLCALVCLTCLSAFAQYSPVFGPAPQFSDSNGAALSGGKLFQYSCGTLTPLATYTDQSGLTQNANPIILNSAGFPANASGSQVGINLGPSCYKFVLQNSSGATLWTVDNIYGFFLLNGYLTLIERSAPSGVALSDLIWPDSTAHKLKANNNNGGAVTFAYIDLAQTWTATQTFPSPVINGTPSGTGIPTVTVKKGTGAGNYTTANTTMTDVDATNLSYAVTIPTGWKLAVQVAGSMGVATGVVEVDVQILDNAAVVDLRRILPTGTSSVAPGDFALLGAITGDGASHTVKLQFKTTNGADSAIITNAGNEVPVMLFTLTPSN